MISIIISTYNAEKHLEGCIESISSQTYTDWELIIIDGGSTDNSVSIIEKYIEHIAFWLSEPDNGIYDAWNKGLLYAKGEWITFIGADDLFYDNDVLFKSSFWLNNAHEQNIKYVYGKIHHVLPNSLELVEVLGAPWREVKYKLQNNMRLAHCASLHHKSLFALHGNFDSSFKIAGDYEFLLREFRDPTNDALFMSDIVVAKMRIGGISGSLQSRIKVAKECARARKVNGVTSFSWEIFWWKIRLYVYSIFSYMISKENAFKLADWYRKIKGDKEKWTL